MKAIVLGVGANLEDDLEQWYTHSTEDYDVVCVNWSAVLYKGEIKYLCTHHPEALAGILSVRESRKSPMDFLTVTCRKAPKLKVSADITTEDLRDGHFGSGSSGLYGVLFALKMGYEKVLIAGMPYDHPKYERHIKNWRKCAQINHLGFADKVRAFSEFPSELLGEPTNEWLNG